MNDAGESRRRWVAAIGRARQRRRDRILAEIAKRLEKEQLSLSIGLENFVNVVADERESWEQIRVEALEIRRLMDKLEKYVLPYRDALKVNHRQQALRVLAGIKERRRLLAKVHVLTYEDATRKRPMLSAIGSTYAKLRNTDLALEVDPARDQEDGVPVPIQK